MNRSVAGGVVVATCEADGREERERRREAGGRRLANNFTFNQLADLVC